MSKCICHKLEEFKSRQIAGNVVIFDEILNSRGYIHDGHLIAINMSVNYVCDICNYKANRIVYMQSGKYRTLFKYTVHEFEPIKIKPIEGNITGPCYGYTYTCPEVGNFILLGMGVFNPGIHAVVYFDEPIKADKNKALTDKVFDEDSSIFEMKDGRVIYCFVTDIKTLVVIDETGAQIKCTILTPSKSKPKENEQDISIYENEDIQIKIDLFSNYVKFTNKAAGKNTKAAGHLAEEFAN